MALQRGEVGVQSCCSALPGRICAPDREGVSGAGHLMPTTGRQLRLTSSMMPLPAPLCLPFAILEVGVGLVRRAD